MPLRLEKGEGGDRVAFSEQLRGLATRHRGTQLNALEHPLALWLDLATRGQHLLLANQVLVAKFRAGVPDVQHRIANTGATG